MVRDPRLAPTSRCTQMFVVIFLLSIHIAALAAFIYIYFLVIRVNSTRDAYILPRARGYTTLYVAVVSRSSVFSSVFKVLSEFKKIKKQIKIKCVFQFMIFALQTNKNAGNFDISQLECSYVRKHKIVFFFYIYITELFLHYYHYYYCYYYYYYYYYYYHNF
jgi:SNF family Na+-dependent transporter